MQERSLICALSAVAALFAPGAYSATITSVPMGGSMVHVNILYNASASRLEVAVDSIIPQLTPLDVTNPTDNFSITDPWFGCLDPSAAGFAFNRQYGFVMDASSDPVPLDMGIWIRQLSWTPVLAAYRYKSTDPKAWDPMFGTGSSTNVWLWNLAMFHPAMAAPPTNGNHSAIFEAFAVDLATGQARADIASASFTLTWTVVASARPILELDNELVLRWPVTATNYALEATASLAPASWCAVTNTPVISEGRCLLPVAQLADFHFYRLKRVP